MKNTEKMRSVDMGPYFIYTSMKFKSYILKEHVIDIKIIIKTNSIERPNLLNQMFYTDKKNKIWV